MARSEFANVVNGVAQRRAITRLVAYLPHGEILRQRVPAGRVTIWATNLVLLVTDALR